MEARRLWRTALEELQVSTSPAVFNTFFKDTEVLSNEDGHIVVAVPTIVSKQRFQGLYQKEVAQIIKHMGSAIKSIEYKVVPRAEIEQHRKSAIDGKSKASDILAPKSQQPELLVQAVMAPPQAATQPAMRSGGTPHSLLNARYTMESFVVGPSNELAYATAGAVANYPGQKYGLFFLYGGVGLGKTHLIQAIGNEILRHDPAKRIRYVSSEQFTNEFIESVRSKGTKNFANLYRSLDVLIIDDIQFLGQKERTQEEFFHTFNTLQQHNKQIVLSSDRPPRDIPHLEDRLRSRFESGMTADIQRPDLETRAAIAHRKAHAEGLTLEPAVAEFLARHFQHNIRELEGAITKLNAYCDFRGTEPSLEMVKGLTTGEGAPARRRVINAKAVLEQTAAYFQVPLAEITGTRRDKEIVVPRQVAMYIMRCELNMSFPKVATVLGKKDHTTVMHSVKKIERLVELDTEVRNDVERVRERLGI